MALIVTKVILLMIMIIVSKVMLLMIMIIVSKVILLMIKIILLSTPVSIDTDSEAHCSEKAKTKLTRTETNSSPQLYAPGKPPGRRYARWQRCKAPGPPCRTRRRPGHRDSRLEEGVSPLQGQGQGGAQGTCLVAQIVRDIEI